MKRLLTRLFIGTIISTTLVINSAFAFTDVPKTHHNFTAIIYLHQIGVLNGYSDNSFRPQNNVNRAEFLKIIIEGSSIPTDITLNTPFPDVDHNAWYGPYVKKAFTEGWIVGYDDGSFHPEQSISKAEALKIIAEAQNWELETNVIDTGFEDVPRLAWFAPYVSFANINNYLEETIVLSPNTSATRAGISEIIFRSITKGEPVELIIPDDTPTSSNTPGLIPDPNEDSSANEIEANFFTGIQLDEAIPKLYYKNEVFIIAGEILSGNPQEATVIIEGDLNATVGNFRGEVVNNHFEIPVHFRNSGFYQIGIISGDTGTSIAKNITVLNTLPNTTETTVPLPAQNLNIDYAQDQTFITFASSNSTLKRLTFTQQDQNTSYLSRQDIDEITVLYSDFENFSEGTTSYHIETANISSSNPLEISSTFVDSAQKSFTSTEHSEDKLSEKYIATSIPDRGTVGQNVLISGTINNDFLSQAAVILPNGEVENFTIQISGSNFTLNYTPTSNGRYIFEVNNDEGIAEINHPVYIGNIIPLIPDFFDLNERNFFIGNLDLNAERTKLLNLINTARAEFGLPSLVLSEELNNLAQAHTDDMANNDFFGHINLNGESSEDRRITAGILTPVGENLSKDISTEFGHYGLLRSAVHRANILNNEWERVGLGITLRDGYIYLGQEFSTFEISATDLAENKTELLASINDLRISNGLNILIPVLNLDNASKDLNNEVIAGNNIDNELFLDILDQNNISGFAEAIVRSHQTWPQLLDSILQDSGLLLNSLWKNIGADIKTDSLGIRFASLILHR